VAKNRSGGEGVDKFGSKNAGPEESKKLFLLRERGLTDFHRAK
jgi:hypothetical protein